MNIREGREEEEERFIFFVPVRFRLDLTDVFTSFFSFFLIYVMKLFNASHRLLPRFRFFKSQRKRAGSSSRPGSVEGRHMPVAVCFNSVNVLYGDGSIKLLHLDTL